MPTVRELGDAKYEIKYAPVQAGKHMISVAIQGVPIHDSPFRMVADPGQPFGPKSSAVGDGLHDATEGQVGIWPFVRLAAGFMKITVDTGSILHREGH